mgnify:CR=1 FL=1
MSEQPCLVGTPDEMHAALRAIDRALGFPVRGRQVGGGRHAHCPEAWDGLGLGLGTVFMKISPCASV